MKRIPLTTLFVITITLLICGLKIVTKAQSKSASDVELRFVSPIKGWVVTEEALQDYEVGTDSLVKHSGKASAFARSKSATTTARAVALRQSVKADPFRGQRVRLSGWLKAEKVEEWAGLWLRIDGEQGVRLSLDNMQHRRVKGTTDWQQYELVLDVPEHAIAVSFGLVLAGKGQAWMDDLRLDKVGREVATTETLGRSQPRPGDDQYNRRREAFGRRLLEELKTRSSQPINLDFETSDQ
jgi:hypothetical protein